MRALGGQQRPEPSTGNRLQGLGGGRPVSLPPNWGAGRNGEQLKWHVVEKEWAFVLELHGLGVVRTTSPEVEPV